eukprot:GILI01026596.1.p2 GENE.GILI01026596.1~~GILI01026596.1.p2  ORF type:complete len:104 (+),score=1.86 GILI01026596.1:182-493(+)
MCLNFASHCEMIKISCPFKRTKLFNVAKLVSLWQNLLQQQNKNLHPLSAPSTHATRPLLLFFLDHDEHVVGKGEGDYEHRVKQLPAVRVQQHEVVGLSLQLQG